MSDKNRVSQGRYWFSPKKRLKKQPSSKIHVYVNVEKTEHKYFEYFCRMQECWNNIEVYKRPGETALTMIKNIIKLSEFEQKDSGDRFIAIFDIDEQRTPSSSSIDTIVVPTLEIAIRKWVGYYYSNPCFELWLLLHFRNITASERNYNQSDLLRLLEIEWKKFFGEAYTKDLDLAQLKKLHASGYKDACNYADNLERSATTIRHDPDVINLPYTGIQNLTRIISSI